LLRNGWTPVFIRVLILPFEIAILFSKKVGHMYVKIEWLCLYQIFKVVKRSRYKVVKYQFQ